MRWTQPDPSELSAEQRLRLLDLLRDELRHSYQAALAAGADAAELAAELEDRRRSLAAELGATDREATVPGPDPGHSPDDDSGGVRERGLRAVRNDVEHGVDDPADL